MKKKYHFNPSTLSFDEAKTTGKEILQRITWPLVIGFLIGIGLFFVFVTLFPSPREIVVQKRYEALQAENAILNSKVDNMQLVLADLQQRDDNLYRSLLQAEPIPLSVRLGSVRQSSYYDSIAKMTDSKLGADLSRKVDVLENELYVQAKSYEEIISLTQQQDTRMKNIPAIQPVLNKDLTRVASGYGWRIDPVYHTRRFHEGMDFTAPTGTDVYATGNGKVVFAGWKQGYGNCIEIEHGFDYMTRYAHLHKVLVLKGKTVHRGDVIGLVGSTGKSTGPHLHYEVHYRNNPVDPRNYYFQDLSPEEYDRMVQLSNNAGNMMD
ncbi:MAG: peptidoglycan DD-metalloendopeptidase family protein [Paludibacteraceae bacterium]|nr:peptidoglycan DD-metalloendopeptidase family protein [Paludibacteraceae bacterium]